jgi:hypothetical protein
MRDKIRELLVREWDPIGVRDVSSAQDEYDAYVGSVARLLVSGASVEKIAAHLLAIETDVLGLTPDPDAAYRVASMLANLSRQQHS